MDTITHKHMKYLNIAIRHAISLQKKADKYRNLIEVSKQKWKWWQQRQMKKNLAILTECAEHNDIIIAMCAFTLEAFINFYAIIHKLDLLPDYNEKDYTRSKWKKYPGLVNGTEPNDAFLNRVQAIMNDRNNIGHYKAQRNESLYSEYSMEDALKNLNEVHKLFQDFKVYDSNINIPDYEFEIPIYAKAISMQYNAVL